MYRFTIQAKGPTTVTRLIQQQLGDHLGTTPLDHLYQLGSIYVQPAESQWPNDYIKPMRIFNDTTLKQGEQYLYFPLVSYLFVQLISYFNLLLSYRRSCQSEH